MHSLLVLWCWVCLGHVAVGKLSKTMENILNSEKDKLTYKQIQDHIMKYPEEEEDNKARKLKAKSVEELRKVFSPSYPATSKKYLQHPPPSCSDRQSAWDSIGEDRMWDLVFVDNDPMEERTRIADRLLKRTKVLIIHDTEDSTINNYMDIPLDFMQVSY